MSLATKSSLNPKSLSSCIEHQLIFRCDGCDEGLLVFERGRKAYMDVINLRWNKDRPRHCKCFSSCGLMTIVALKGDTVVASFTYEVSY